jgi:hypothetical protein
MKSTKIVLLLIAAVFCATQSTAENMILGDERSIYQATDDDFKRIQKGIEYLAAKQAYVDAQVIYQKSIENGGDGQSDGHSNVRMGSKIPRELRGSKAGDRFLDSRGNTVEVKTEPTTYVSHISGMSGNLSAELIWGDSVLSVRKGDSLIGGDWKIDRINRDDIVIKNGGKIIRIGKLPINISSIVNK